MGKKPLKTMRSRDGNPILQLGRTRIQFFSNSKYWAGLIRKNYSHFIKPHTARAGSTVTINSATVKSGTKSGKVSTTKKKGLYRIHRQDFFSEQCANFNTVLTCARNRYSFDSWFRVFLTLSGIKKSFVLAHSSGLCLGNAAYLFPGVSGKGKSTITRIFGKKKALSDEIVMIAREGAATTAFSTPFWGELKKGTGKNYNCRVKGLYFIEHGACLKARKLSPGEALKKLLATILFFSREKSDVAKLLSITASIVKNVPAYELSFSLKTKRDELFGLLEYPDS